jgi:hypothetical protein
MIEARVIDWDGTDIPAGLRDLPPGRYVVEPVDQVEPLTPEEEEGILAALDALDGGGGIPLAAAIKKLRNPTAG